MSTRSQIFIQNDDCSWTGIYCHYDGYPAHMLPALEAADPEAIRQAQEIRQIHPDGKVEAFADPRPATRHDRPTKPEWAEHVYILTATGWEHATTDAAAIRAAAS